LFDREVGNTLCMMIAAQLCLFLLTSV